jgi:hypothetical protein
LLDFVNTNFVSNSLYVIEKQAVLVIGILALESRQLSYRQ